MDVKKTLIGTIVGATVIAGVSGKKALGAGVKIGFATGLSIGVTTGILSTSLFIFGKNKIQEKTSKNLHE